MMLEEQEAYEKVRRTLVTDHVTEKRGIVEFGLTFVSEKKPKMPPRKQMEMKRGFSEMETYDKMENMYCSLCWCNDCL